MKRRNVTGVSTAGGHEVGSRDRGALAQLATRRNTQDARHASERARRGAARRRVVGDGVCEDVDGPSAQSPTAATWKRRRLRESVYTYMYTTRQMAHIHILRTHLGTCIKPAPADDMQPKPTYLACRGCLPCAAAL